MFKYNEKKSNNKSLILLIAFMLLAITLMMTPAWIHGEFFVGGGDIKTQWDPFYYLNRKETISALKSGRLPFYSWILFLGTNLWASKASYGLFDVYNVLTYPLHTDYLHVYMILCYMKMLIGAVSAYKFFKYIEIKDEYSFLGALCFGLSSYGVYFTSEFGFLSFYSFLPLYFLGIEIYLKERGKKLFVCIVVLLFLTSYYLFFAVTLLSPFYFIYRYYNIHKKLGGLFKSSLLLVSYYLIGFLISGIVIVPVFCFIMQNDRVGSGGIALAYSSLKLYLHLLISALLPSQTYIYGNNIFDFASHNLKEICFFSSSCVALLLPQIIKSKDRYFRKSTTFLYLTICLFVFIPVLSSFLNGLSEPSFRFSSIFVFLNIFISIKVLDEKAEIDKKLLFLTLVVDILLMHICFGLTLILENESLSSYAIQFSWILVASTFMVIYYFLLSNKKEALLKFVLLIELCIYSVSFGNRSRGIDLMSYKNARSVLGDYNSYGSVKMYLDGLDEKNYHSFYRVYVPYESLYWSASRNMNLYYGIPGVMTYDSTFEPSFNESKEIGNVPTIQIIGWEFSVQDPDLLNFLNVKYALVIDEKEVPFKNYQIVQENYRGGIIVAENTDYVSVGRTYADYTQKNDYNKDPKLLTKTIITDNPEVIEIVSNTTYGGKEMFDVSYYSNHLEGYIDCDENSFLLLSIPYDKGWKILVDGVETKKYNVNCGFIGVSVPRGTSRIDMYFIPEGFKLGACLTGVGILLFFTIVVRDLIAKKKQY